MKKKGILIVTLILSIAALGFGIYQSNASEGSPKLSEEEVRTLISSQYPGTIEEMTLETDFNQATYDIVMNDEKYQYELKVDGNSGEILYVKEHVRPGEETDELVLEEKASEENSADQPKEEEPSRGTDSSQGKQPIIDAKEAIDLALRSFSGFIEEVELERDKGILYYEIDIVKDMEKAEIHIDAYTGETLLVETKMRHHRMHHQHKHHHRSSRKYEQPPYETFISAKEVVEIVEKSYDGYLIELELDREDGRYIYEVELKSGKQEIEIELDAQTGEILKVEFDD